MKNFGDIFSNKVKEAFNSYDASHLAEKGWNAYVRKHGGKHNHVIIIPLWAKVASIAVLVTVGVLLTMRLNHWKPGEAVNQIARSSQSNGTESAVKIQDTSAANPEITVTKTATAVPNSSAIPVIVNRDQASDETTSKYGQASGETISESGKISTAVSEKTGILVSLEPTGPVPDKTARAGEFHSPETVIAAELSSGMNLPGNPVEIRLADNANTRLNLMPNKMSKDNFDIPREKKTTTIMTGLSGMMASIDNTSSISQGVSIGFYVEQQLTRRISVRPGLAMARLSYAMENTPGNAIALDYTAPELNGMSGTITSFEGDMDIVSIEVPVNFVFSLRKRQRSNLFVTTGASTLIYLSQHLSGNFNNTYTRETVDAYGGVSYESMTTSVEIESEQEILNHFDFMGLANFSAGYSLPFGKTSHLVFEPFLQLPVKDLTSLNLRIRYGGLSMKIQF